MDLMGSSTNGAGPYPNVTHPPGGASANGNSAPTQVLQIYGLERAAGALEKSSETNRMLLICAAVACLVAVGMASAAVVLGWMNHSHDMAEIDRISKDRTSVITEYSQYADLGYAYNLKVREYLSAHGVQTDQFGPIPKPPAKR